MKLSSFYKIYYKHRINKANHLLKIYIFLILPFSYLVNFIFIPKITSLDKLDKKNFTNKSLDFLLQYYGSDKAKKVFDQYSKPIKRKKELIKGHGYSIFYEKYLYEYKDKDCDLLELGSFDGNAVAAFYFYLNKSSIYAGDIFPDIFRYKSNRIKIFYIDCSSEISINEKIIDNNLSYNIIIEDAGHFLKDQIICLFMCFKKLKSKGIYIVEELNFPDTREDMRKNYFEPTLKQILNKIIKGEDFNSVYIQDEDKKYFLKNYDTIDIHMGNNGSDIVFIRKK